jgi:hypothetical protein
MNFDFLLELIAMAYTNTNAENVQLGSCSVLFGSTDLGLTKGGVEVSVATNTHKVTVDQFGQTEINEYIMGRTCTVKVPMAESDLALLAAVIPGAVLVTDGTVSTKKKITVPHGQGTSLRAFADELVLHPIALAAGSMNQDFTVPIAAPKGEFQFAYKFDEERVYNVEFMGYPDLTTGLLYVIGDTTATA